MCIINILSSQYPVNIELLPFTKKKIKLYSIYFINKGTIKIMTISLSDQSDNIITNALYDNLFKQLYIFNLIGDSYIQVWKVSKYSQ